MSLATRLLGANPGVQVSSALSGSLTTPGAKGAYSDLTAFESIATATVGAGGSSSVTFNSIPQTYKHLQVRFIANSSASDNANFTFNNDTGSNYTRHRFSANGSTVNTSAGTGLPGWYVFSSQGFASGSFGPSVVDILDYTNTGKYKTGRALSAYENNSAGGLELTSGLWLSTAAITRIDITCYSGTWAQYSTFALYGIQG